MKRKPVFDKAFNALTCAYMSGLLMHGSVHASAMGCIVHHKRLSELRTEFGIATLAPALRDKRSLFVNKKAVKAVNALSTEWRERLNAYRAGGYGGKKIAGYTMKEADLIERTFNSYNSKSDPDGFLGLHAVFNALCDMHSKKRKTSKVA